METSDWISLGAVCLALLALGVSLFEAMSNKPRLRISASRVLVDGSMRLSIPANHPLDDGSRKRLLEIVIVNYGRQPTMISHISVVTNGKKGELALSFPGANVLPHLLEVGRAQSFLIPFDVPSSDALSKGSTESLGEIIARGGARVLVRDAWHTQPHYVSIT